MPLVRLCMIAIVIFAIQCRPVESGSEIAADASNGASDLCTFEAEVKLMEVGK